MPRIIQNVKRIKRYIPPAGQEIDNWLQTSDIALSLFTNAYQLWTIKDFRGSTESSIDSQGRQVVKLEKRI